MKTAMAALCLLFCAPASWATILPENTLHLEDNLTQPKGEVDEATFNEVIDEVNALYKPIIAKHGAALNVARLWTDSTVNAAATQSETGDVWFVFLYGGLARRPEITRDSFVLVFCHELGHHLAGFPFVSGWAANEGQSDYFATQVCARKLWTPQLAENAKFRDVVPAVPKTACDEAWEQQEERDLCYRTAMASRSLAQLFATLMRSTAEFETPDMSRVRVTNNAHPGAQCRLDTYLNGALCSKGFADDVIPGKKHPSGQGSLDVEYESAKSSCTSSSLATTGTRPLCWFAPNVNLLVKTQEVNFNKANPGGTVFVSTSMRNDTTQTLQNHPSKFITSSPDVTVKNPTSVFPAIPSGETASQVEPFEITTNASARCGSRVDFKIDHGTYPTSYLEHRFFRLGELIQLKTLSSDEVVSLRPRRTTHIPIKVDDTAQFEKVLVNFNVKFSEPQKLKYWLTTPSGKEIVLHDHEVVNTQSQESFLDEPAAGEWVLHVENKHPLKVAKLNGWSISFANTSCD
ncbi:MAG: proprotein convertase P-domain-containing protein [Oligoflexales bacterium]